MRLRCFFDCGAGVCLWAADAGARASFDYAVELAALPLSPGTVAAGEALMAAHTAFVESALAGSPPDEAAVAQWRQRARDWLDSLRAELGPGFEIEDALEPPAWQDDSAIEPPPTGRVIGCFRDEVLAGQALRRLRATRRWRESVEFDLAAQPGWVPELPCQLLDAFEGLPGWVAAWHQESEGGPGLFLAGDPVEHAIACVRDRNVTGWVNFLGELRTRAVRVDPGWLMDPWRPTAAHRLDPGEDEAWEMFLAAAGDALAGRTANTRMLERARDRLFFGWKGHWPANAAEALLQAGFARTEFHRFVR